MQWAKMNEKKWRGLTPAEQKVIVSLAKAWNQFLMLPVTHPSDADEFLHAIHQAQNLVYARPTRDA